MIKRLIELSKNNKYKDMIQFVKFGIVGFSNTVISYLLNVGILFLLKGFYWNRDYIFANVVSFILSVLWSFYWNNKYVFAENEDVKRNVWKTLARSFIAYGFTGIVLNNILSFIWIEYMGISKYLAPLLNLIVSVPVNFLLNKKWAFKN